MSARGKNTSGTQWPRPYLLQIHAQAVEHGFVWIEDITEERARSLRMSLYRVRRRSDGENAHIIPPEYGMVVFGEWKPSANGLGRFAAIYSALPDGEQLPVIRTPADGEAPPLPEPVVVAPTAPIPTAELITMIDSEMQLGEAEVGSYVDRLRKRVEQKGDPGDA